MLHTRKAQTEEAHAAMAARNARRIEIVKRAMGDRYAHHPVNHVRRRDPRPLVIAGIDVTDSDITALFSQPAGVMIRL